MALGVDYARQDCSLARALEVVGERWTLLILRDCFLGVRRFSDFEVHLDISKAVLSARLAALVEAGLLARAEAAGHREYAVTERARALWPAIFALTQWGEGLSEGAPRRLFEHVDCGGRVTPDGRCTACGLVPVAADLETRPGPGADPTLRDDAVSRALRTRRRLLEPLPLR
ncbi:helix-turn-helix domain-containing protein [soil metagenome]